MFFVYIHLHICLD